MNGLICIILANLLFVPVYFAMYIARKGKEKEERERALQSDECERREAEMRADAEKVKRALYKAWMAFHKVGMGVPYLSAAIRSDEMDMDLALAVLRMSRVDTMKWADTSTPDCAKHWEEVAEIFDKAESEILGEGA